MSAVHSPSARSGRMKGGLVYAPVSRGARPPRAVRRAAGSAGGQVAVQIASNGVPARGGKLCSPVMALAAAPHGRPAPARGIAARTASAPFPRLIPRHSWRPGCTAMGNTVPTGQPSNLTVETCLNDLPHCVKEVGGESDAPGAPDSASPRAHDAVVVYRRSCGVGNSSRRPSAALMTAMSWSRCARSAQPRVPPPHAMLQVYFKREQRKLTQINERLASLRRAVTFASHPNVGVCLPWPATHGLRPRRPRSPPRRSCPTSYSSSRAATMRRTWFASTSCTTCTTA